MNAKLEKIHEDMKKAEEKELYFRQKKEELAKRYEQEQMAEVRDTLRMGEMTPAQFDKMMNFLLKNRHAYGKDQKMSMSTEVENQEKPAVSSTAGKYDEVTDETELKVVNGGGNA